MPSPLSGLTQAAASPTRAQLGPAMPVTAPPIGSSALVGARRSSPSPYADQQPADLDLGRPLGGGESADAEVHLRGAGGRAQREDPAVTGQHLAPLAAELEVGA